MRKTLTAFAVAGLLIVGAAGSSTANVPSEKGCPGYTQGNNLYWPFFWVRGILLGSGIIPGDWITGEGGCLPNA